MKIEFTKEQYESLLKLAYMGNGMINTAAEEQEEDRFNDLEDYLLSHAKDFGLEKYAEYDEDDEAYYPAEALEEDEEIIEYIHRYNDFTFWDKLIYNLVMRDMEKKYGEAAFARMSGEEYLKKEKPFASKYEKEFAKNGLNNLVLLRSK